MSRLSKNDPSSYSEPGNISKNSFEAVINPSNYLFDFISLENIVTRHTDLFWNVDFEKQIIGGEAVLHFVIVAKEVENIVSGFVNK